MLSDTFLFYYSLLILFICAFSSGITFSAYVVTRRKTGLYACFGFIAYFFDASIVLFDDFIHNNLSLRPPSFDNPFYMLAFVCLGACMIHFLWQAICEYVNIQEKHVRILPAAAFIAFSCIILIYLPSNYIREFLFFSVRAFLIFWMLGYVALHYVQVKDPSEKTRLWSGRVAFFGILLCTILLFAENIFFLIIAPPGSGTASLLNFYPERNFAENLLMIAIAFFTLRRAWRILSLFHTDLKAEAPDQSHKYIEEHIPFFAKRNKLSSREAEILYLILIGKDNQNIASELHLSVSTVKVHVHNILHKTGLKNRQDLARKFWSNA